MALLPLTVAAPELSPWLAALNLAASLVAIRRHRRTALFFLALALLSAWPLAQVPQVERRMAAQLPAARAPRLAVRIPTPRMVPDSLPLGMLYYRPQAAGARPAIIDLYAGAWQSGSPADDARLDCYLASKGYAVFAIDYRHAPAFRFPAQIEDVHAALSFIHANAARYQADPDRLAICGRSSGGQLALLAAYEPVERQPVRLRAAISFYGPTDLLLGYDNLPAPDPIHVRRVLEAYIGGTPAQLPDQYRLASPVQYVRPGLPPTLLIQGGRDHLVKPVFARRLYRQLEAAGDRAIILNVPWAEHAFDAVFSGLGNQLALHYMEAFLADVMK